MNRRWLGLGFRVPMAFPALLLSLTAYPLAAQRLAPGPFAGFEAPKARAPLFVLPIQDAMDRGEVEPRKPFALTVLAGTASGAGAGFLLGNLVQDWSGPDGAGAGLVSGTLMGIIVGLTKWNSLQGFLAGIIPGYCVWVIAGTPEAFVQDPLFLLGIPGAVAGAVSASPGG